MYRRSAGSSGGASAVIRRSARRQTVRATWSAAPAWRTARQDKATKRRQFGFEPIDQAFEPLDIRVAEHDLGHARRDGVGRVGQLGAEREEVALNVHERLVEVGGGQ